MQIKDGQQEAYESYKKLSSGDAYSHRVVTYSEDWANFMERELVLGKTIAGVARSTSREADTDGITGFMYGCAVQTLSKFWIHGEELRRWHNLDTQLGNEGEKANESGGILNPALLTVTSLTDSN
jgi:hypothetical protein